MDRLLVLESRLPSHHRLSCIFRLRQFRMGGVGHDWWQCEHRWTRPVNAFDLGLDVRERKCDVVSDEAEVSLEGSAVVCLAAGCIGDVHEVARCWSRWSGAVDCGGGASDGQSRVGKNWDAAAKGSRRRRKISMVCDCWMKDRGSE